MKPQKHIYLDHAATTPIIDAAKEAIMSETILWANPSSPHSAGRAAKARLEKYRRNILDILGWKGHLLFTSGASEAINMVMKGAKDQNNPILLSGGEHEAVFASSGADQDAAQILTLTKNGYIDEADLSQRLNAITRPLCAIQSVNNETGVIQPLEQYKEIIDAYGGILFADCSQSAGKLELPDADIIAISGHKLGGPPGIGALLIKDLSLLCPTGGQEQGYRRGTENGPYVAALSAALSHGYGWMDEAAKLRTHLDDAIIAMGGEIIAKDSNRIATIASYRMKNMAASAQLIEFDMKGISVSAGSACSSGTLKTSHVLKSMGYDDPAAKEVIRVSFGPDTSQEDIDIFIATWRTIYERIKNGHGK